MFVLFGFLFISVTPWFFSSANISSLEHWESSLFLITPLEDFRVLCGHVLIFKLWNIFIFSKKFVCFLFSVSIIIVPFFYYFWTDICRYYFLTEEWR